MPKRVIAEVVALGPMALKAVNPGDTLARPACHLQDMRDCVRGPNVCRVALDRLPPDALRRRVIACLLQSEGIAAENKTVARHACVPGGEGARQHVAHPCAISRIEEAVL